MRKMYDIFRELHPEMDIDYKEYSEILREHNKKVVIKCLEGKTYTFGKHIGNLRIAKIKRKFKEVTNPDGTTSILKTVNFGETRKLKAKGINKTVYFTDDWWFRWYWNKNYGCNIPHKSVWRFHPTGGPNGITRLLAKTIKGDSKAHLRYDFTDNIIKKKKEDGL